ISARGIPARRSHNIAVDTPTTRGPGTLALVDRFNRGQHIIPGCRLFQIVFLEEILSVEKQLRIADIRQSEQLTAFVRMFTDRDGRFDEIIFWTGLAAALIHWSQRGEELLAGESGEPRIVEHDQIVSPGSGHQVYMFLLKKVVIGKLRDADLHAGKSFIIARRLFERIAL